MLKFKTTQILKSNIKIFEVIKDLKHKIKN